MEITAALVEDALEHLWDYSYLGTHPLAALAASRKDAPDGQVHATHLDRGMALSRLLQGAIQQMQVLSARTHHVEARLYDVLRLTYVEGERNHDVARALGISERTFYRERQKAVEILTRLVAELAGGND